VTSSGVGGDRAVFARGTARSLVAAVFVVVNLTLVLLWSSVASTLPDLRGLVVASIATLAVGIVCLMAVIVLGACRRASSAANLLATIAVAQLIAGFTAMTLLGAFADLFALQIFLATMVSSVTVLILGVATLSRRARGPASGRPRATTAHRPHRGRLAPPAPDAVRRRTH
jgi:hypothetical protein